MKPLRPNVALAIDGGGIRGALVARALSVVEETENISLPRLDGCLLAHPLVAFFQLDSALGCLQPECTNCTVNWPRGLS